MNKKVLFIINVLILIIFSYSTVKAATGIMLDGSFTDWINMPSLADPAKDEVARNDIVTVKWYPDNTSGNLYLYAMRLASGNSDWRFNVFLTGDLGQMQVSIYYKRLNRSVNVSLYNSKNNRVWSASGKWGDLKNPGTRVEFYVPLSYIVSTPNGGYQISTSFKSGNDNVPDQGYITISSVSTGPVFIIIGIILSNVTFMLFRRRRRVAT